MFLDDPSGIFFGLGRSAGLIKGCIDEFLSGGSVDLDLLQSLQGEWCFFYFKRSTRQLIFGRDIFARKSLCWKISSDSTPSLELSTFPAGVSSGWHELYPGTFFLLTLPAAECENVKTNENRHIVGHMQLRYYDQSDCLAEVPLLAISFFQKECLAENDFFRYFSNNDFKKLASDHLLKPTASIVDSDEVVMESTSFEFYRRFQDSLRAVGVRSDASLKAQRNRRIAVLFSGGVDSLLVALGAGRVASDGTEIVLINVAFGESPAECGVAPDRQRSINAFRFLRETSPTGVIYRLMLVDVGREELAECRRKFIAKAISPCFTVLDDSIGCVLWFASQASGVEFNPENDIETRCHFDLSRPDDIDLVLVGSGADEQLGGYARHRTVFDRFGYERLAEELAMEMGRIGLRNFGRDDRVGTSNGRNIVAPFLEEPFVEWLNGVPLSLKVDYDLPRGEGEKRLLRQTLIRAGGVTPELAAQPKRAMQFGTRIAKMENRHDKGSDRCDRLDVDENNTVIACCQ